MKRLVMGLALVAFTASAASAQFAGIPVYNSPKGGTGVTINGDFGKPNDDAGGGNAFGARASLGLPMLTVGAGVTLYKPGALNDRQTSLGANVAVKVFGGGVLPVSINVQGGAALTTEATSGAFNVPKSTTVTGAVGIAVSPPTPGLNLELWASPGIRYVKPTGFSGDSNFGFAIGANVSFGMIGVHAAYDYTKVSGASAGIFGIGAHVALKAPLPM